MIMEDFENESNKNSSWSMSEISEPSSETLSSSSTNQEPECSLTDSNILDEINKKTKTGRINFILIFTLMNKGSFTATELHHDMIKVNKTPVTFEIQ